MKFRHLATGTCPRCRYPFIPVVRDQQYHPLCDPDADEPLTVESLAVLLAAEPATTKGPS